MTCIASRHRSGHDCVKISQLESIVSGGGRIALWGWGREGRAAYRAIRSRLPSLPLTLFASAAEVQDAQQLDDAGLDCEVDVDASRLSACDVVIKSPGISPYRPEAIAAARQGTRFIGGTSLWFAERPSERTLCVTGTKGKSTTTALLAHLLRTGGHRTALCGNIGMPLLELLDAQADFWAIELSSYQTRDVGSSGVRPELAIVTNVFPEHLDWHGSEQCYVDDKLALLTEARPRIAVLNAGDARLSALELPDSDIRWYGGKDGWHLRDDMLCRGGERVLDTRSLPIPGRHNRGNLCAVLTAIDALGLDARSLASAASGFIPLPHRLQALGARDGIRYVNDSISTTPHATLAALDVYRGSRVAVLVGGHDRGLDWSEFSAHMRKEAPAVIVTMGQNGGRIHALLEPFAAECRFILRNVDGLADAMTAARDALASMSVEQGSDAVILMSPGAPSFGPYHDYTERGRHFAELAGFDPSRIAGINGMGIA